MEILSVELRSAPVTNITPLSSKGPHLATAGSTPLRPKTQLCKHMPLPQLCRNLSYDNRDISASSTLLPYHFRLSLPSVLTFTIHYISRCPIQHSRSLPRSHPPWHNRRSPVQSNPISGFPNQVQAKLGQTIRSSSFLSLTFTQLTSHRIHTHYFGFNIPHPAGGGPAIGVFIYIRCQPG